LEFKTANAIVLSYVSAQLEEEYLGELENDTLFKITENNYGMIGFRLYTIDLLI
jgi:hypothetical protein